VLDGAVNGALFVAYIKQQVVPSLACGDVLIMDTLPVHKAAGVRQALEAAGITLLLLPAYSPDLNPIEMVFAKVKALLRKAAIRTVDALWRALGKISQPLTREEGVNYLRHCGYGQSG
jgi:transposase